MSGNKAIQCKGAKIMLDVYAQRAKRMDVNELAYAINDIQETLVHYRDRPLNDPYVAKLYAEFDAYTVAYQKRH